MHYKKRLLKKQRDVRDSQHSEMNHFTKYTYGSSTGNT